jgi:hypothetical protein
MIRRLLYRFQQWVADYANEPDEEKYPMVKRRRPNNSMAMAGTPTAVSLSNEAEIQGLNFTVMPAIGGLIVQMRTYDNKTDRNIYHTHLIPDGEDVAQTIGHIVSMEILRS